MSAISTVGYHVNSAINLYNSDLWIVLAKENQWTDNTPPTPVSTDSLQSPWCYKKTEVKYLVVPDNKNGTITYRNQKWRIVLPSSAYAEKARWVYVMTNFEYDEAPLKSYSQIGINTNVVPKDNIPVGQKILLPTEIKSTGITIFLDNRASITRSADTRDQVAILIEC